MTQVEEEDRSAVLEGLPPSAWMRHGVSDPDNSVAILGKKGGVGKSSLTTMLADAAVRFGLNVLGIDGDPQGNLSFAFDNEVSMVPTGKTLLGGKVEEIPDRLTIVEVLDADQEGVVDEGFEIAGWRYNPDAEFTRGGPLVKGKVGTLGIVPAYKALENISRGWGLQDVRRLDKALNQPLEPGGIVPRVRWDITLTDMLPGGADLARAFLLAQRRYLLLTTAEPFGVKAIADTLEFARDVRDNWGSPKLTDLGLIFTSYNPQGVVTRAELGELRQAQASGNKKVDVEIWAPRVSTRTLVPNSQGYRAPVSAFLSDSKNRAAAEELCQIAEAILLEILKKIGHPDAEELEELWRAAWPKLSPWATGEIGDKEIAATTKEAK
ncbi:ParA family protein [Nocardia tengchongensis]|uniref:ParA family protein n=1 Tax=Nocardia tengchongensis TaxID=2055889 RepID=UPI0036ABC13E